MSTKEASMFGLMDVEAVSLEGCVFSLAKGEAVSSRKAEFPIEK